MVHYYWNDWYFGWGWILWFGFVVLIFLSVINWGYTYRINRTYYYEPQKNALNILNERYARGELTRDQYKQMKSDISAKSDLSGPTPT